MEIRLLYFKLLHFAGQRCSIKEHISFNNSLWTVQLVTKSSAIKVNTVYNWRIPKIYRTVSCSIFFITKACSLKRNSCCRFQFYINIYEHFMSLVLLTVLTYSSLLAFARACYRQNGFHHWDTVILCLILKSVVLWQFFKA